MSKKKYEEANIEAIADSIREKTGTEKTYKTKDMAEGVGEVFEAGNQAQNLEWENRVHGIDRGTYTAYFMSSNWNGYEFKKTLKPTSYTIYSLGRLFYNYAGTDLPKNIDLSGATQSSITTPDAAPEYVQLFTWSSNVLVVPDYNLPALNLYQSFNYLRSCHTIEKIRINESCIPPSFVDCNSLVNVNFEGTIAGNIAFPSSPLSPASLKSIIKHLKNYVNTSSEFAYTLTVKASAWEALESEGFTDEDYRHILSVFPDTNPTGVDSWRTFVVAWLRWNLVLAS